MTTDMITLKLDRIFLKEVDSVVKEFGFQNRTEFIRNALREKLDEAKMKKAILELSSLKGVAKKKISVEQYEHIRKTAFDSL
ncbi:hypothetical protein HYY69_03295 [Candidatus Woesearchaeota archaeon]|nr:hypothetical protein [Candidatus Woesearchaeota archaeon]